MSSKNSPQKRKSAKKNGKPEPHGLVHENESAGDWITDGERILLLRDDKVEIELRGLELPTTQYAWIICERTKEGLRNRELSYTVFGASDSLAETIAKAMKTNMLQMKIIDVDPSFAAEIGRLAAAYVTSAFGSAHDPKWSWGWHRTFHFRIVTPDGLDMLDYAPYDKNLIGTLITGWHSAIGAMAAV